MHNRIRMVVGSFLVKHLRINWKEGEKHFRNCLLDFNEANNVAQWQWVAGCGADAAPYFRIFNPILQGEKFDKLTSSRLLEKPFKRTISRLYELTSKKYL